mmetsp:Transcript_33920/g.95429  ORF Transcript_33920/g.95429 Transcript_33920/m.95429 type:complete len:248 (+) Transcript_33920:395-1138(+)
MVAVADGDRLSRRVIEDAERIHKFARAARLTGVVVHRPRNVQRADQLVVAASLVRKGEARAGPGYVAHRGAKREAHGVCQVLEFQDHGLAPPPGRRVGGHELHARNMGRRRVCRARVPRAYVLPPDKHAHGVVAGKGTAGLRRYILADGNIQPPRQEHVNGLPPRAVPQGEHQHRKEPELLKRRRIIAHRHRRIVHESSVAQPTVRQVPSVVIIQMAHNFIDAVQRYYRSLNITGAPLACIAVGETR